MPHSPGNHPHLFRSLPRHLQDTKFSLPRSRRLAPPVDVPDLEHLVALLASMALYKYSDCLDVSEDLAFDGFVNPTTPAPWSGIYRCSVCDLEVTAPRGQSCRFSHFCRSVVGRPHGLGDLSHPCLGAKNTV